MLLQNEKTAAAKTIIKQNIKQQETVNSCTQKHTRREISDIQCFRNKSDVD